MMRDRNQYWARTLTAAAAWGSGLTLHALAAAGDPARLGAPEPLPPLTVRGTNLLGTPVLLEERTIGDYQQPEWTTRRRFATTRVYVIPPWQVEFEQWWRGKFQRDGSTDHLLQSEIGVGLPGRLQLDFYVNVAQDAEDSWRHQGEQVEARWALADWGRIPLNPTLYAEWKFNDGEPDAYELKLLLGDEIAPHWHWAVNLFYEQEVGGGRGSELGFSQAVSYTLLDEKLGLGLELKFERLAGPVLDGESEVEFLLGPSFQWRPTARIHLDCTPLFGTTTESPRVEMFVVFGYDFGGNRGRKDVRAPTSVRSR